MIQWQVRRCCDAYAPAPILSASLLSRIELVSSPPARRTSPTSQSVAFLEARDWRVRWPLELSFPLHSHQRPTKKKARAKMIRRPPTAITISSVEVAELKAYRERAAREEQEQANKNNNHNDAGASAAEHGGHSQSQVDDSLQSQRGEDSEAQDHPADRAARLRRERTARERIGL